MTRDLPLIHYAESYHDADMFFLSGFLCPDPFLWVEKKAGRKVLAVSSMEVARAIDESCADRVLHLRRGKGSGRFCAVADLLKELGFASVRVLPSFPVGLARELETSGVAVTVDSAALRDRRRAKSARQIEAVRSVQRRVEKGFGHVRDLLSRCSVRGDALYLEGVPLRAERLRSLLEVFLLERGLEAADTIVAPGPCAADPHWRGAGPVRPGTPIVVDVFPRDRQTRYHSDMTRTFAVGPASAAVRRMHSAVAAAQDAALERLVPGVPLGEVHRAVTAVFRRRGYPVSTYARPVARGFLHTTGHGVGLAVHEPPSVAEGGEEFRPGDVITIEPGLYDRRTGAVRIEDVVVCHPGGAVENLTRFPRDLIIEPEARP